MSKPLGKHICGGLGISECALDTSSHVGSSAASLLVASLYAPCLYMARGVGLLYNRGVFCFTCNPSLLLCEKGPGFYSVLRFPVTSTVDPLRRQIFSSPIAISPIQRFFSLCCRRTLPLSRCCMETRGVHSTLTLRLSVFPRRERYGCQTSKLLLSISNTLENVLPADVWDMRVWRACIRSFAKTHCCDCHTAGEKVYVHS